MMPSLGATDLLKHLTELRKPVYLLDRWFNCRSIQLRNSQMEQMQRARYGQGGTASMSSLGPPPSWHLHEFTNTEAR